MKLRVALTEAAQEERLATTRFYREVSLEAARSFDREFRHELALLKERPLIGPPHVEGTRRKVFPHFPYSLIYSVQGDLITIYALAHHSRHPEYWLDRVKNRRGG